MKKFISLFLAVLMIFSLATCGAGGAKGGDDDKIENAVWDELEKMGKIVYEDGKYFFIITQTQPADITGSEVTQEALDNREGREYSSATLNPDGSVTYKMTKKQHKAMLDSVCEDFDTIIKDLVNSPDFALTEVNYNENYTVFDVHLNTEELGTSEGSLVSSFYIFGEMYAVFSGYEEQNITVNFYSQSGKLLETVNSSDLK